MDLTTIVINLAQAFVELQSLAGGIAFGIGLYFVYVAVSKAIKATRTPGGTETAPAVIFTTLIVGALILDFSGAMSGVFSSMSGEDGRGYGLISYPGASAAGRFAPALNAVLTIMSTFGWWYALKGWTMFKRASEGGGGGGAEDYAWKGMIHVLGGAALINIAVTIEAFKETLGLAF